MSRFIVPFPILIIVSALIMALWGGQWLVYVIASAAMGEEVWSGECQPQNLSSGKKISLNLTCNGEDMATTNSIAITAWVNDLSAIQCTKSENWNRQRVSWNCQLAE